MKKVFTLIASVLTLLPAEAQTLSLDSCRAMALRSNKQLSVSRVKEQVAANVRKSARTKYLPHLDVVAGWELTSREISILSDDQKDRLTHLGTNAAGSMEGMGTQINNVLTGLVMKGAITPDAAQGLGQMFQGISGQVAGFGDVLGQRVADAFRTDTRSIFAGSVMVNQPLYMGGAITAYNRIADVGVSMASLQTEAAEQEVLYNIDKAYWMVVSLKHKQELADKYLTLVEKLNSDVHKMIETGVATRADGLMVDVRVNEAEMTKTQVDNGLTLSRMLLCQLCGMPLETDVKLEDEANETMKSALAMPSYDKTASLEARPEMQLLSSAIELSESATKLARAAALPQLALSGGYMVSNPNVFNGYEKKFGGMWNLGILLRVPVFDWGDAAAKVRAAKLATNMAQLEYNEAEEKINLQITQCEYRLSEANKRLLTAQKNIQRAEENLRCANLGFKEGVMQTSDVMAAQTAWLQAQTQHVDAEIEVRLSEAGLKKAVGVRE